MTNKMTLNDRVHAPKYKGESSYTKITCREVNMS